MISSYERGHKIYFKNNRWVYMKKPCIRCGNFPTKEGFDFCLGHIQGVEAACCGHGIEDAWFIFERRSKS